MNKEEFNNLLPSEQLNIINNNPEYFSLLNKDFQLAIKQNNLYLYLPLKEEYQDLKILSNNNEDFSEISDSIIKLKYIEKFFNNEQNNNKNLKEELFYELTKNNEDTTYLNAIYTADRKSDFFTNIELITNYKKKYFHDIRTYNILKHMEYENKEKQEKIKRYYIYYKIKLNKYLQSKNLLNNELTIELIPKEDLIYNSDKKNIYHYKEKIIKEFYNSINLEQKEFLQIEENLKYVDKKYYSEKDIMDKIIDEETIEKEKFFNIDNKIRLYQHKLEHIIDEENEVILIDGKKYSLKGLDYNQKITIYDNLSILKKHSEEKTLKILKNSVPILPLAGDFDFLKNTREVTEGYLNEGDFIINGISIVTNSYNIDASLIKNKDENNSLINLINKQSEKTKVTAKNINGKIVLESDEDIVVEVNNNGSKVTGLNSTFHITKYYYDKLKKLYKENNVIHENDLSNFLIDMKIKNKEIYPEEVELFAYYYYDSQLNKTKVKYGTKEDIEKFTSKLNQKNIIDFSSKDTLKTYFDDENDIIFDSKKLIEEVKVITNFNKRTHQEEHKEGKSLIIPLYKNRFFEQKGKSNINKTNLRNFYALTTELEIGLLTSAKLEYNLDKKVKKVNNYLNNKLKNDYHKDLDSMKLKIKDNEDKTNLDIDYENSDNKKYNDALHKNSKTEKVKKLFKNLSNKTSKLNELINNKSESLLDIEKIDKLQEEIDNELIKLQTFLNKELSDDSIEDKAYYKTIKSFLKDNYIGKKQFSNKQFSKNFEKQFLTKFWQEELNRINDEKYIETRDYNSHRFNFYRSLLREDNVSRNLNQNMMLNYMFLGLPCVPDVFKDFFELYTNLQELTVAENIYKEKIKNSLENEIKPAIKNELLKTFPFFKNQNSEKLDDFVDRFVDMNVKYGNSKVFSFNLKNKKLLQKYLKEQLIEFEDAINVDDINTGPGSEIDNVKQVLTNSKFKLDENLNLALITELKNNLNIEPNKYSELSIENSLNTFITLLKENIKNNDNNDDNLIFLNTIKNLKEKLPEIESTEEKEILQTYFIDKEENYKTLKNYHNNNNKNFNNIIDSAIEDSLTQHQNIIKKYFHEKTFYSLIEPEINKLKDLKDINLQTLNDRINSIIKTTIQKQIVKPIIIDNCSDFYRDNFLNKNLEEIIYTEINEKQFSDYYKKNNFNIEDFCKIKDLKTLKNINLETFVNEKTLKLLNNEDKKDLYNKIQNYYITKNLSNIPFFLNKNFVENLNNEDKKDLYNKIQNLEIKNIETQYKKIDLTNFFPYIETDIINKDFSFIINKLDNNFKEHNNIDKTNILNLFSIVTKYKDLINKINKTIKSEKEIVKIKENFVNIDNNKVINNKEEIDLHTKNQEKDIKNQEKEL